MPTKLNSFILPDNVVQKMKRSVEYSRIKDVEVGFNLCTNNRQQLHDEKLCEGTECSVDIPKACNEGEHVGLFHTHPHSSSKPSIRDIANAYQFGIGCVGSVEENNIKCYVRKDKTPKREGLENIIAAMIRYESPLLLSNIPPEEDIENYRKWLKARKNLSEHYLHTVDVI